MIRLCSVGDVPEGTVRRIDVEGFPPLAVYRIEGHFYATEDRCTHAGASLSEGLVDGDTIECPLHGGAFHIPTGEPTALPCVVPLRTYAVRVVGDGVLADPDGSCATHRP